MHQEHPPVQGKEQGKSTKSQDVTYLRFGPLEAHQYLKPSTCSPAQESGGGVSV